MHGILVFIYATVWSEPSNLYSQMHWLDRCTSPQLMSSESGYSLALMQTACQVIPDLTDMSM